MPFSQVASHFEPEQLAQLSAAFDEVWPRVLLANASGPKGQAEWLRKRLANYLLACASNGEFNPDKLTEQAIRALTRRHRTAA
jgi:hypothetical protein